MQTKHIISKEDKLKYFGQGEWVDEPDEINFKYKGYECKIVRMFTKKLYPKEKTYYGGFLCGYVVIPSTHKCYQKHYDDINVDVHGGLTFSDFFEDKYLIGFDCAHFQDLCPSMQHLRNTIPELKEIQNRINEFLNSFKNENDPKEYDYLFNKTYRNIDFCVEQCKSMVDQLIAINKGNDG